MHFVAKLHKIYPHVGGQWHLTWQWISKITLEYIDSKGTIAGINIYIYTHIKKSHIYINIYIYWHICIYFNCSQFSSKKNYGNNHHFVSGDYRKNAGPDPAWSDGKYQFLGLIKNRPTTASVTLKSGQFRKGFLYMNLQRKSAGLLMFPLFL